MTRRGFLRGAGVALALPALEGWAAESPRRLVCIGVDLGFHPAEWTPKGVGREWVPGPLLEPLARHRDAFTVFSQLDHPNVNSGHSGCHAFLSGVLFQDARAMP